MKKKKNEYKPKRYKGVVKSIISVIGILVLAYVFVILGYSIAQPFGDIGEGRPEDIVLTTDAVSDQLTEEENTSDKEEIKAYWLKETDIETVEKLQGLINVIGKDYNTVVVPLKIAGGKLNYSSSYEGAVIAEIGNELDLATIYNTIKNKGYTPAASINSMNDNLYPNTNKNSGFLVKSTKTLWKDKQSEDGKAWLNPSATETKQYLSSITAEVAKAGFEYIICTDMEYPSFSKAALEDIGGNVALSDRYLDLVANVNKMNKSAEDKESKMWLEVSAYDLLSGNCEVMYKPIMLSMEKYVLQIDINQFNQKMNINGEDVDFRKLNYGEKIEVICNAVEKTIYKSSFIPEIYSSTINVNQKSEISEAFKNLGYSSYVFKMK